LGINRKKIHFLHKIKYLGRTESS